jgi:hypothetical protein
MLKNMRKKKPFINLRRHADDLLIVSGAALIVYATSLLSMIAAMYAAGALLIIFGVLVGMGMEDSK